MAEQARLICGAMSGTSGDGVDVAIVRISGHGLEMSAKLLHHHHLPFDQSVRDMLFSVRDSQTCSFSVLAALGRNISLAYARAINETLLAAHLSAADLSAVAAHGQTLYHNPPNTIQWFDPSLVAAEVGCVVISDFRRADCAAGGQGAPLVPFADYLLFRDPKKNRILLNIGGIANITFLRAGASLNEVVAFDTGPGNCLSDYLCRKFDPSGPGFDERGERALRGQSITEVEQAVLSNPYFKQPPPKSTDGPGMIGLFEKEMSRATGASLNDLLATAASITARTIHDAIAQTCPSPDEIIVSGGGVHNQSIMKSLAENVSKNSRGVGVPPALLQLEPQARGQDAHAKKIKTLSEFGISPESKEAIAFALLGASTLDGIPSNVPSVTGATRPVVLGSITPKP